MFEHFERACFVQFLFTCDGAATQIFLISSKVNKTEDYYLVAKQNAFMNVWVKKYMCALRYDSMKIGITHTKGWHSDIAFVLLNI